MVCSVVMGASSVDVEVDSRAVSGLASAGAGGDCTSAMAWVVVDVAAVYLE